MSDQKVGDILDGLGVTLDLDDGDLVASAVVIAKIVQPDGSVTVGLAVDESCTWLDQLGLIKAAEMAVDNPMEAE